MENTQKRKEKEGERTRMVKREGGRKWAERESSLRVWLNAKEGMSEREKDWHMHKYRWIDR